MDDGEGVLIRFFDDYFGDDGIDVISPTYRIDDDDAVEDGNGVRHGRHGHGSRTILRVEGSSGYLAADFCRMGGFDQLLFLSRWDEDCDDHEDFEDIGGTTTRPNGRSNGRRFRRRLPNEKAAARPRVRIATMLAVRRSDRAFMVNTGAVSKNIFESGRAD